MIRRILITGCNGQLGRAINQVYANDAEVELFNTDRAAYSSPVSQDSVVALDITNIDDVMALMRNVKLDVIINCAAFTAVDAAEEQADLAMKINAIGPRNLSIAATEVGAKLIHISTDYVFDGSGYKPYTEFDPVSPNSVYGKTKLAGERFVEQFAQKFFMIRTAWLYGEGKNFVKTMLALSENHDKLTVVNDQIGSPTSAFELAKLIRALEDTENYGLFHGTCEGSCSWADFAAEIMRLAGKSTFVEGISTEAYQLRNPVTAPRPAYSVLDNYMLRLTTDYEMAHWKDAIAVYMKGVAQ